MLLLRISNHFELAMHVAVNKYLLCAMLKFYVWQEKVDVGFLSKAFPTAGGSSNANVSLSDC